MGLGFTLPALLVGTGPLIRARNAAAQLLTEDPDKFFRRYQWTVIDTEGIFEFPGETGGPEIWAYTEQMSYPEGEAVALRVHTNAPSFRLRVERDGRHPRLVMVREGLKGMAQKTPPDAASVGCSWEPSLEIDTSGWEPGVYVVYLETEGESRRAHGEHLFVVRSRTPGEFSKACIVLCTCTYTAYNDWGGANSYRSMRNGVGTDILEPRLSTQRPWARGFVALPDEAPDVVVPDTPPAGWEPDYPQVQWALENGFSRHYPDAGYAMYEQRFLRWANAHGMDFEFATQHDLHDNPSSFDGYSCLIFVGHDEYWTWEMRDTVDTFVSRGGNVARFGGNFWCQVRLENEGQIQICYKDAGADPISATDKAERASTGWDEAQVGRPAAQTFGLRATGYSRYGVANPRSSGGFTVYRPWHWAFRDTDLYYGDVFGGAPVNIFGFETDGLDYVIKGGLPFATQKDNPPVGIEVLALSPSVSGELDRFDKTVPLNAPLDYGLDPDEADELLPPVEPGADLPADHFKCGMIVYFEHDNGRVFNAGSCSWVRGLQLEDYFTSKITLNVITEFT